MLSAAFILQSTVFSVVLNFGTEEVILEVITTKLLLLLSTSYTKYKISINTKEKQKKEKSITQLQRHSIRTELMFYGCTDVIFANSTVR